MGFCVCIAPRSSEHSSWFGRVFNVQCVWSVNKLKLKYEIREKRLHSILFALHSPINVCVLIRIYIMRNSGCAVNGTWKWDETRKSHFILNCLHCTHSMQINIRTRMNSRARAIQWPSSKKTRCSYWFLHTDEILCSTKIAWNSLFIVEFYLNALSGFTSIMHHFNGCCVDGTS